MQSGNRGCDSKHSSSYRKRDSSNGRDPWRQNLYNNDQRKNPWFRDNQRNSSRESDFVEPDKFPKTIQASDQKLDIIKKDKKLIDKGKDQSPEKQNQIIINLSDIQNPKIVEEQSASQPAQKQSVKSQGTFSIGKYHSQKSYASQAKKSLKHSQTSLKSAEKIKKKPLLKQIGFNDQNKIINLDDSPPKTPKTAKTLVSPEATPGPQRTKRQQAIQLK